jgi:formate dehydrogenase maturation protein FdhE
MQRKRCSKCGRTRNLHYFYKRASGSSDGYWGTCKDCDNKRTNEYRYGNCEGCGTRFYNVNFTLCKKCRNHKSLPVPVMPAMEDIRVCKPCVFLADCKRRVMQKDADWMPYCFVTSKHHDSWLKEYA